MIDPNCEECQGDGYSWLAGRPAHYSNKIPCSKCITPEVTEEKPWYKQGMKGFQVIVSDHVTSENLNLNQTTCYIDIFEEYSSKIGSVYPYCCRNDNWAYARPLMKSDMDWYEDMDEYEESNT